MSAADKTKLDGITITDYLKVSDASSTYATKTAIADMATNTSVDGKLAAYTNTENMNAALALKADKLMLLKLNSVLKLTALLLQIMYRLVLLLIWLLIHL